MAKHGKLLLTSRDDIVVAVPYLIGFHPADSLVCIILQDQQLQMAVRLDLPQPAEIQEFAASAAQTATVVSRHGSVAILIGYGPADRVKPAADLLTAALSTASLNVREMLRVEEGRYWCLCGDAGCADGVAYNPTASIVPAEAAYLGIAPLPDRAALEKTITPVTGPEHDRMLATTHTALRRLHTMLHDSDQQPASREHVVHSAMTAVRQAYECASRGQTLSDEDVAWLTAVLMIPEVRDHAWSVCNGSDEHRRLWIDVTRRAAPYISAAPACLLAITAYLSGDGALTNIAVVRALRADPTYPLAHLLDRALQAGVPPQMLQATATDTTSD